MRIHPTAVVDPKAELGEDCEVGPGAVIEADVVVGKRCIIGPHAFIGRYSRLGDDNKLHIGAVVGHVPQDLSYDAKAITYLKAGNGNVFREYCVIHRSAKEGGATIIGDRNFFMNHSHVGHDTRFGSEIILGASALLAGYVNVGDRAYISGNTAVHQFCRVGRLGMLRGVSGVSMDIPPFCIADNHNQLRGINVVGLRRAGISDKSREALRTVFRLLFRSGDALVEAINKVAAGEYGKINEVVELLNFCRESKRGIVSWRNAENGGSPDASTDNGGEEDY
ncbi:MAG: acyl-ACP--UDP-N-acetylglucosamine O-acyltransferase [Planctomycetota bacterium]